MSGDYPRLRTRRVPPTTPGQGQQPAGGRPAADPRHLWHGGRNYTLRPGHYTPAVGAPDPFDLPSSGLALLCHPARTGLPAHEWDAVIGTLMSHHNQRGKRTWTPAAVTAPADRPGTGRARPHPSLTGPWPPSCTSVSPCRGSPSPCCQRPAGDDQQTHPQYPANFCARPDAPSSLARTGSAAWTTYPNFATAESIAVALKIKTAC